MSKKKTNARFLIGDRVFANHFSKHVMGGSEYTPINVLGEVIDKQNGLLKVQWFNNAISFYRAEEDTLISQNQWERYLAGTLETAREIRIGNILDFPARAS